MICILAPARVGLNTSRERIFPQLKLENIRDYPFFIFALSRNATAANDSSLSEQVLFLRLPNYLSTCPVSLEMVTERSLTLMSSEGIASKKTLVKMSRHCREVAWRALILHPKSYARWTRCDCSNWWVKIQSQVKGMFCIIALEKIYIIPVIKRTYYFFESFNLVYSRQTQLSMRVNNDRDREKMGNWLWPRNVLWLPVVYSKQ